MRFNQTTYVWMAALSTRKHIVGVKYTFLAIEL